MAYTEVGSWASLLYDAHKFHHRRNHNPGNLSWSISVSLRYDESANLIIPENAWCECDSMMAGSSPWIRNIQAAQTSQILEKRSFSGYDDWQEALWQALDDVYWAKYSGFDHCRQPDYHYIDDTKFNEWREKVVMGWKSESGRDNQTRGLTIEDLPDNLWLYWYQRSLAASKLKKTQPFSYPVTAANPTVYYDD